MAYHQRDYPDVAYPSKRYPDATVATSGCGPTCVSILLGNLLGVELSPPDAAAYAQKCGARVDGGTDMGLLSANVARDYGLTRVRTDSTAELEDALKTGGMAIINVHGDIRNAQGALIYTGVFSSGGHYVVALGMDGDTVYLADPGLYAGKYSGPYRAARVAVQGDVLSASLRTLADDSWNRTPRYYLFRA